MEKHRVIDQESKISEALLLKDIADIPALLSGKTLNSSIIIIILCTGIKEGVEKSKEQLAGIKEKLEEMGVEQAEGKVGTKEKGENQSFQYVDVKAMLLLNYCMALQTYSLLKVQGKDLEGHEIFDRLAYLRLLIEKLKPLDKKVDYQIEKLLKSSISKAPEQEGKTKVKEDNMRYKPNLGNFDTTNLTNKVKKAQVDLEDDQEDEPEFDKLDNQDQHSENVEELGDYNLDSEDEEVQRPKKSYKKEKEEEPQVYRAVTTNPMAMIDKRSKTQKQKLRDTKRLNR